MQVGDLVTYWYQRPRWSKGQSVHIGLIIETGKFTGNRDVKVLWKPVDRLRPGETLTESSAHLSLIDSLTSS